MNQPHPTPWRISQMEGLNRVYTIYDADDHLVVAAERGIDRRTAEYLIAAVNGRDDLEAELRASRAAFQGLQAAASE